MSSAVRVFVSHSHANRKEAVDLEAVLLHNGADTFLDQDQIEAGDVLPDRLREGVSWCNVLLLVWSHSAKSSKWIDQEWNLAYDLRKKIIPYVLDSASLPSPLDSLVHVTADDSKLAYSNLLTAVFGRKFEPPIGEIFAGKWKATFNAFGLASGTAMLELRNNGQIIGGMQIGGGDFLGSGLQELGLGSLLQTQIPIAGNWSYEAGTRMLELNTTASGYGTQGSDTIRIIATGHESGPITGQDLSGRTWTLERLQG